MQTFRVSAFRALSSGLLLFGVALLPTGARSETNDPVVADALFREARELFKTKKYEEACPKFAESYRLDPAHGTLYNLAECEEKRGKIAASLERWRALIDTLTADNKLADPRLPVARLHVASLAKRVPRLTLKFKAGVPKEAIVLMDNVELRAASLNTELPVEPGAHTVIARAAYRLDGEFKVSLKEGELKELVVEPGGPDGTEPKPPSTATASASAPPLPPPTAPTTTSSPPPTPTEKPSVDLTNPPPQSLRRPVGLVVAGVGLASLVGAGVTGVMLNNRKDTVEGNCNSTTRTCNAEGLDAAKSTGTLVPLNLALWAVGVAGVGLGGYLYFSAPSGASAQIGASTSGSQASLWLHGRF